MNRTDTKQRGENTTDDFQAYQYFNKNEPLIKADNAHFSKNQLSDDYEGKSTAVKTILKQVLLFFPGATLLYIFSFILPAMISVGLQSSSPAHLGLSQFLMLTLMFLVPSLLIVFGLGNWRKPKHLLMPSSVFILGILTGILSGGLFMTSEFSDFIAYMQSGFLIYLFPLALILPVLVKRKVTQSVPAAVV